MFKLPISRKIPALVACVALFSIIGVATLSIMQSSSELKEQSRNQLSSLTSARASQMRTYLEGIREDVITVSSAENMEHAVELFTEAFQALGPQAMAQLQADYISGNPNAAGEKHKFERAAADTAYNQTHARFHPWLRRFMELRGYYDVFLISPEGDIVYSVFKEEDYATNLMNGEWKDSGLADAFRDAMKTGTGAGADSIAFSDFHAYAPSHGAPASFIAAPIMGARGLVGVLAFQMPIGRINRIMQATDGMGETGETYLVGADLLMRSDSRFSRESTILARRVDTAATRAAFRDGNGFVEAPDYRGEPVISAFETLEFEGVRWAILGEKDTAEILAPVHTLRNRIIFASLAVLLVLTLVGWLAARTITQPLISMCGVMSRLANHNLDVEISGDQRGDEIGSMAKALRVFKENMSEADRMRREQEAAEARAEQEKRSLMNKIADDFKDAVGSIIAMVSSSATELNATSATMASTAEQTRQQSSAVAAAAEQASGNVQTVASATEEMAASVDEIKRRIVESSEISKQAVSEADQANHAVKGLSDGAERIGNVVQMIQDIANQTNLLALNATIEAARAGEAGKGFAVVASEVKALASQTAKATDEIGMQIAAMQNSTRESVSRIEGIGQTITQMNDISSTIAAAVEEQASANIEIARSVQEAATGTTEVSANITGVSQAAGDTGAAAAQVQSASAELARQSSLLEHQVEEFLGTIRAA